MHLFVIRHSEIRHSLLSLGISSFVIDPAGIPNMSDEKKIIIDEDWKSQVEAERESLAKEQSEQANAPAEPQALPPASFQMLLTSLATEAMISLGQLPNMGTQELETNVPQARYAIDMLQVLEEKTQGNLTPGEEQALKDLLHQLRLMFVSVQQGQAKTPATDPSEPESGGEPSSPIVS